MELYNKFLKINEEDGWDSAIKFLKTQDGLSHDVYVLCDMYGQGYETVDYNNTGDPDSGLCFQIREFCMQNILKMLPHEEWTIKNKLLSKQLEAMNRLKRIIEDKVDIMGSFPRLDKEQQGIKQGLEKALTFIKEIGEGK